MWTYVARNLSRPLALAFNNGWANVVVGNPPWVAFRHISSDLQKRFKELAKGERVYVGGKFGTQNDLSALFTVRCVAFYLRPAVALPLSCRWPRCRAASSRIPHGLVLLDPHRLGRSLDDGRIVQPLFPVPSCVVFGRKRATAKRMPDTVTAYSGTLPFRDAHEAVADRALTVALNAPRLRKGRFMEGQRIANPSSRGTLVRRML